ncbi:hypothetical protein LFWB_5250 [Candidatus Phytoplasma luffae]|uniref:Uncharacterized protein n=1 Tax=Loofah witches'-broom phytoplasma TaxID=35773 RepID=A0A975FLB7_LOWBP|nr:hypothetical protein [Candidatus Phytoplasma luffae]QTX03091.1 hypothetical protein LFWB_5250 [Candidatus Phytoplasma luffae]
MTKNFLQKNVIISLLVGLIILLDFVWSFVFLQFSSFISFVKLPLIIIFISGFLLGFKSTFVICVFYNIWHIFRSFMKITIYYGSFELTNNEIILSLLLDYIFPDLIMSISGLFFVSEKKTLDNKKIFFILFIIIFLRHFSFYFSSCWIYAPKMIKQINEKNVYIWSFWYNLAKFFLNFIFSFFIIFYLKNKLKNLPEINK